MSKVPFPLSRYQEAIERVGDRFNNPDQTLLVIFVGKDGTQKRHDEELKNRFNLLLHCQSAILQQPQPEQNGTED